MLFKAVSSNISNKFLARAVRSHRALFRSWYRVFLHAIARHVVKLRSRQERLVDNVVYLVTGLAIFDEVFLGFLNLALVTNGLRFAQDWNRFHVASLRLLLNDGKRRCLDVH